MAVKYSFLALNHIPSVVFPKILFDNRKKRKKSIFEKMADPGGRCECHVDLFWTFAIPKKSNTLNLNYAKTINVIVLTFLGVLDLPLMYSKIVIIFKTFEMVKNRGFIR